MKRPSKAERLELCERQRGERALQLQRGEVPTAPDVTKPESDHARGVYFWQLGSADPAHPRSVTQGSHVTPCTPEWCPKHATSYAEACVPCLNDAYFQARRTGRRIEPMLEPKTTEREIEVELSDEEREERRKQFEVGWEQEQKIKADKLVANQGYNADLKEIRALQKATHDAFTSGKEKVRVKVFERRDDRRGAIEIVNAETQEVVDERAMTSEERQLDWTKGDGQKSVKAHGKGKNGASTELAREPLTAKVGEVAASKPKRSRKVIQAPGPDPEDTEQPEDEPTPKAAKPKRARKQGGDKNPNVVKLNGARARAKSQRKPAAGPEMQPEAQPEAPATA